MKLLKITITILLLSFFFTSCVSGSNITGSCKGNKIMMHHQGYSRKAFKF